MFLDIVPLCCQPSTCDRDLSHPAASYPRTSLCWRSTVDATDGIVSYVLSYELVPYM